MRFKVNIEDSGDSNYITITIYPVIDNTPFEVELPYRTRIVDLPKDMLGQVIQKYYEENK